MRAAVYHGREDVRIEAVPEPTLRSGELLVRSLMAGICGTDAAEYSHGPLLISLDAPQGDSGHSGPVVLGHEFVGEVIEVADDVSGFAPGDRVVTGAGVWCGRCELCQAGRPNLCARYYAVGLHIDGGLAERVAVPAFTCAVVPDGTSDQSAAMAQPMAIALHGLNRAAAEPGQAIVVIGAGGIGAFVLAAAAVLGLGPLVAVDISESRLAAARELGDVVAVDAGADDAAAQIRAATGGGAHVVVEASGAPPAPELALEVVRRGGRIVLLGLQTAPRALDLHDLVVREVDLVTSVAHVCREDLPKALEVLGARDLVPLLVDRVVPLERLVEDGLIPLTKGSADGKILVQP